MATTFKVGDLVRCTPDHPDQRIHEVVSITHHEAREPQPHVFGCPIDNGCDAYTTVCAVPITAYPEYGKHMTPEGYVAITELSDAQQSWLAAKIAIRDSAA